MRRRGLLAMIPGVLVISPSAPRAQPAPGAHRIGYLTGGTLATRGPYFEAFRQGLQELGYREGHNLVLDARSADGRFDRLPAMAGELVGLKPDVLFVSTTPGSLAAKNATRTVPIVFAAVADPLGIGLVESLARPGGNITGITNVIVELTGKRLQLLKEVIPGATRVAILVNPDDANAPLQMRSAEEAAQTLGIELRPVLPVRAVDDLDAACRAAVQAGCHAALRMVDPTLADQRRQIAELSIKYRLPVMLFFREDVDAGGLIAYGASNIVQYRQAAGLVHKILRGAKPADLPVEQPNTYDLTVNLRTARALGIDIPPTVLARASEVIE